MWTLIGICAVVVASRIFISLATVTRRMSYRTAVGYLWIYTAAVGTLSLFLLLRSPNALATAGIVVIFGPGIFVALRQLAVSR
ncbi:hypothetical protein [Nonomuraea sp. NPDC049141]|uniref:hypothetical protein n=1 Tax=Nonomuraea sp. NPDC049141 TaxID=3155500 RepID=UPI0033EB4DB0